MRALLLEAQILYFVLLRILSSERTSLQTIQMIGRHVTSHRKHRPDRDVVHRRMP